MNIKVYKTKTCAVCKNVLYFLNSKGHKAEEIYIDDSPELQQYVWDKSGGMMQVPFTVISKNGDEKYISGGNIAALSQALAQ